MLWLRGGADYSVLAVMMLPVMMLLLTTTMKVIIVVCSCPLYMCFSNTMQMPMPPQTAASRRSVWLCWQVACQRFIATYSA